MSKPGDVRICCYQDDETGRIEYWEYVCRTIRKKWAYWILKNECTWVKRSKKHGDWGWCNPMDPCFREMHPVSSPPYSATKHGAVAVEIARVRYDMRDKERIIYDDVLSDGELLKQLLRSQKRIRR